MLNGINKRRLSKYQRVKIQNYPEGTGETILEEFDKLVTNKPDYGIMHVGRKVVTEQISSLNSAKRN